MKEGAMKRRDLAEHLFNRIGTGADNAMPRPDDRGIDRALRHMIHEANMSGDCIINDGFGYFRPGLDDDVAFEDYIAKERHRARDILLKTSRMQKVFDRRYERDGAAGISYRTERIG